MNINFKQPKYVLPLICLPFFLFGYYVYAANFKQKEPEKVQGPGMQNNIADVSEDVKKRDLTNKLDAYRNRYKEANGISAISSLQEEKSTIDDKEADTAFKASKEQRLLDSIARAAKVRFEGNTQNIHPITHSRSKAQLANPSAEDRALEQALSKIAGNRKDIPPAREMPLEPSNKDPMETFKKQMAYLDSMKLANNPAYKAEQQKKLAMERAAKNLQEQHILQVVKAEKTSALFNTILVKEDKTFIKAIIDENVTGYAGSRIRVRLLEDIKAGSNLIPKGTYIYAEINGFTEQRVNLGISSILAADKILPVKLQVYDLDGLPGLYVPASAFREFSKDLGTNTVQGVSVDNTSTSFAMSMMDKVFQSTSGAVASLIRKNKAKIKYGTFVYLIDPQELKNAQKN